MEANSLFDADFSDPAEAASIGTDPVDSDMDGVDDFLDLDSDNDGVADLVETQGQAVDRNGDGKIDNFADRNSDGLDDTVAFAPTRLSDSDGDGKPDHLDTDATIGLVANDAINPSPLASGGSAGGGSVATGKDPFLPLLLLAGLLSFLRRRTRVK